MFRHAVSSGSCLPLQYHPLFEHIWTIYKRQPMAHGQDSTGAPVFEASGPRMRSSTTSRRRWRCPKGRRWKKWPRLDAGLDGWGVSFSAGDSTKFNDPGIGMENWQETHRTPLPLVNQWFPCVARVRVSGLGVEGVLARHCSTVRNRPQPFATVRNRPRDGHMAVPMVSFAEGVVFGGFICGVASFCVAGVALRDIQTCFVTCRKSYCVAGAILLRRFQKMRCSFRGRRSTLDVSIVILRGRRSTLDVSCCVLLRIALAGLRQVATRCRFCGRRGILWDMPKIAGSLARTKHRFWGSKFRGS